MAVNPVQVQKYLSGLDYPCSKRDLVEHARQKGADPNIIRTLQDLPYDSFHSVKDVSHAIGLEE